MLVDFVAALSCCSNISPFPTIPFGSDAEEFIELLAADPVVVPFAGVYLDLTLSSCLRSAGVIH